MKYDLAELQATCDHIEADGYQRGLEDEWGRRGTVEVVKELLRRIDAAIHELGVPDGDYPAPVANAYDLLTTGEIKESVNG